MAVVKVILRSILYGAPRIPDSWLESIPGGFYKTKPSEQSGRMSAYKSTSRSTSKVKIRHRQSRDEQNNDHGRFEHSTRSDDGYHFVRDRNRRRPENRRDKEKPRAVRKRASADTPHQRDHPRDHETDNEQYVHRHSSDEARSGKSRTRSIYSSSTSSTWSVSPVRSGRPRRTRPLDDRDRLRRNEREHKDDEWSDTTPSSMHNQYNPFSDRYSIENMSFDGTKSAALPETATASSDASSPDSSTSFAMPSYVPYEHIYGKSNDHEDVRDQRRD